MNDETMEIRCHVAMVAREIDPDDPMRPAIVAAAPESKVAFLVYHQLAAWHERYLVAPRRHTGAFTGNPVYVMRAWQLCRHFNLPAPSWVLRGIDGLLAGRSSVPRKSEVERAKLLDLAAQIADEERKPAPKWNTTEWPRIGPPDVRQPTQRENRDENLAMHKAGLANANQPPELRAMGRQLELRLGLMERMDPDRLREIVTL